MATPTDIRNLAADRLGIKGEGTTLRAEHSADLDAAYLEVHDMLEQDNLLPFSNTSESIPDAYKWPLAALVSHLRATTYEVSDPKYARLVSEGWGLPGTPGQGLRMLHKLAQVSKKGTTEIEYF